MMRSKTLLPILIVLLLALSLFFRFYKFGQIPPGLNRDGASIGYTAYSILKTGHDEYGTFLPLSIRSFGDWKLPLYVYLTIPSVAIFGLNETAVYLISAISGILSLLFVFLLTKELFPKEKLLSLFGLITLAFLPWHLHLSRYNHEGGLGLMLVTAAVYFFIKSFRKKKLLILASFLFSLTLFTYHTYLVFTPLFVTGLTIIFFTQLKKQKSIAFMSLIIFLFFLGTAFKTTFTGNQQKSSIFFFTDKNIIHQTIELPRQTAKNPILGRFLYNKPIVFSKMFLVRYLNTFSPNFLALKGGNHPNHDLPNMGNIFFWQYPLFIIGLLIFLKKDKKNKILLIWLILAPIASSLTKDAPNSGRASPIIIPLTILISLGANFIYQTLKNKSAKNTFFIVFTFLLCFSLLNLYQNYFKVFPQLQAKYWGAGYKQLVTFLNQEQYKDKKVIIERPTYSPYIYFLFYSKYNPEKYQQEVQRYQPDEEGFVHVKSFNHFTFQDFELAQEINKDQLIVVFNETLTEEQKEKFEQLTTIQDYNQTIFAIFTSD